MVLGFVEPESGAAGDVGLLKTPCGLGTYHLVINVTQVHPPSRP